MTTSILYVTPSLGIGGTERHLLRVAMGLKARGYNISFYCFGPDGEIGEALRKADIDVSSTTSRQNGSLLQSLSTFFRLLRQTRPDVVHFFLPKAYLLGGPLAVLAGCKKRIMSRRSLNIYQQKHKLAGWVERRLHGMMHKISGNSRRVLDQLQTEEGAAKDKLHLIYNGIEPQEVSAGFERKTYLESLGLKKDLTTLILVANLIPYKGHGDLIKALSQIQRKDWQLVCVGRDEGIQQTLITQAHDLNIGSNVHFLGQRQDIANLLHCADIGLLVSHEEGFSNAVLEAMDAGLAMVVTDVGGNAEAVIDGENGYVVPAHHPQKLCEAILKLMDHPDQIRDMAMRNTKRVRSHFTLEACLDGYEALYQ